MLELQPLGGPALEDITLSPGSSTLSPSWAGSGSLASPIMQVTLGNVSIVQSVSFATPETGTVVRSFSVPGGATITAASPYVTNSGSPVVTAASPANVTQPFAFGATLYLASSPFSALVQGTDSAILSLASASPFSSGTCTFPNPTSTVTFTQSPSTVVAVSWDVTYDTTTPVTCSLCSQRSVDLVLCDVPGPGRTSVIQGPVC